MMILRLLSRFVAFCALGLSAAMAVMADNVAIEFARFEAQAGGTWSVSVTLRHADTGWEHYADGWRVVSPEGENLGTRTLYHPHETEQPFTRSLGGIKIPTGVSRVFVEAHDKVHGWTPERLEVRLDEPRGEHFEVRR